LYEIYFQIIFLCPKTAVRCVGTLVTMYTPILVSRLTCKIVSFLARLTIMVCLEKKNCILTANFPSRLRATLSKKLYKLYLNFFLRACMHKVEIQEGGCLRVDEFPSLILILVAHFEDLILGNMFFPYQTPNSDERMCPHFQ